MLLTSLVLLAGYAAQATEPELSWMDDLQTSLEVVRKTGKKVLVSGKAGTS
jgi:hypothetical protein